MATREELKDWLIAALKEHEGRAKVAEACETIWKRHKEDLKGSGNLLYTWQYDVRWAALVLRKQGKMKSSKASPRGIWELASSTDFAQG
jgi:hypothetical protein